MENEGEFEIGISEKVKENQNGNQKKERRTEIGRERRRKTTEKRDTVEKDEKRWKKK